MRFRRCNENRIRRWALARCLDASASTSSLMLRRAKLRHAFHLWFFGDESHLNSCGGGRVKDGDWSVDLMMEVSDVGDFGYVYYELMILERVKSQYSVTL